MTKPRSLYLWIGFLAFMTIAVPGGMLNIAWTFMQPTFDVSITSLGALLLASSLGHMSATFSNGQFIRKIGLSNYLILGAFLGSIGYLGYIIAPSWLFLLLVSYVAGLGFGVMDSGLNTFVSAGYSAGQLNWLHASFGVGATLGPWLITRVIVYMEYSWQIAYLIPVFLYALLFVLFLLTRKGWHISDHGQNEQGFSAPPAETLKIPILWLLLPFFLIYAGLEVGAGQLANTLFVEGRGVALESAAMWISLYWASFTVGRILVGFIADKVSTNLLMHLSLLGILIGSILFIFPLPQELGFIGLVLMGFSQAPIFALQIGRTHHRVGLRHAANAVGFQIGFAGIGSAIIPGLIALFVPGLGEEVIAISIFILAISLYITYILIRRVHERSHPEELAYEE